MKSTKVLLPLGLFIIAILLIASRRSEKKAIPLDAFFQEEIIQHEIPGISACIIKDDQIKWMKAYGWADVEEQKAMSAQTVMNIGSVSKTLTATAILQLWEQGQLSLEENINTYLPFEIKHPSFPNSPITISQLLRHSSSIKDNQQYDESYSCSVPQMELGLWIQAYFNQKGAKDHTQFTETEPGTTYHYSNVAFGLLGYLAEVISGESFDQYCKENIFEPLGMDNTSWDLSDLNEEELAKTYVYVKEQNSQELIEKIQPILHEAVNETQQGNIATCTYGFPNYPDGLLRTSTEDLSKFLVALMNDGTVNGKRILQSSTIEKMLRPQENLDPKQGLAFRYTGFQDIWGHGGDDPGVQTGMYFSPSKKIGMIVFQNNNMGSRTKKLKQLFEAARDLD